MGDVVGDAVGASVTGAGEGETVGDTVVGGGVSEAVVDSDAVVLGS